MDCKECNEKLSLYLDHELNSEEVVLLKKHLEICKPCKEEHEKYAETLEKVCHLASVDAPADFHERFMLRFKQECKPNRRIQLWTTFSLASVAAAAVVLLIVVLQKPNLDLQKNPTVTSSKQSLSASISNSNSSERKSEPDTAELNKKSGSSDHGSITQSTLASVETNEDNNYAVAPMQQSSKNTLFPNSLLKPVAMNSDFSPSATGSSLQQTVPYSVNTSTPPRLVRQTGEISGDDCAIFKPEQLIMHDPTEMKTLWARASVQALTPPQVDWKRQVLGAIFLGKKTGRGYEINLLESQRNNTQWVVKYKITSPTTLDTQASSYPFLVFVLPRTPYPVVFIEE